jgi:hypothetical protein
LADLIHHCLSFDALRRPERMSEVQGELDRIADKLAESGSGSHKVLEW